MLAGPVESQPCVAVSSRALWGDVPGLSWTSLGLGEGPFVYNELVI